MTQNQKLTQPKSGGFLKYKANFTDTAERKSTDAITKKYQIRHMANFFFFFINSWSLQWS